MAYKRTVQVTLKPCSNYTGTGIYKGYSMDTPMVCVHTKASKTTNAHDLYLTRHLLILFQHYSTHIHVHVLVHVHVYSEIHVATGYVCTCTCICMYTVVHSNYTLWSSIKGIAYRYSVHVWLLYYIYMYANTSTDLISRL